VVVRINDRGPVSRRRIIDLSPAAAKELGILDQGVMRVRLDVVSDQTAAQ
jgi:rare lipoprotein A